MKDLIIKVKTDIVSNNLPDFAKDIKSQLAKISTDLQTDDQFIEAKDFIKSLKKAEDELKASKERIFETGDLSEINATINELSDLCRTKRLDLNRQVTTQETERKAELITKAVFAVNEATGELKHSKFIEALPRSDFENQIKGKSKLDSMKDALDRFVGITVTDLASQNKALSERAGLIETLIKGNESLFNFDSLMTNPDAPTFITERIQAHEKQVEAAAEAKAQKMAAEQAKQEQPVEVPEQPIETPPASTVEPKSPGKQFNYSITLSLTCDHESVVEVARTLAEAHGRENVKLNKLGEVA